MFITRWVAYKIYKKKFKTEPGTILAIADWAVSIYAFKFFFSKIFVRVRATSQRLFTRGAKKFQDFDWIHH